MEMPKYFNYNYNDCKYYQVSGPSHDHYTYNVMTNSWYEDVLIDNKGVPYYEIRQKLNGGI